MKKLDMTILLNIRCGLTNTWIEPGEVIKLYHSNNTDVYTYGQFHWSYEKRGFVFDPHIEMNSHHNLVVFHDDVSITDAIEMSPSKLTTEEKMVLINLPIATNKA